MIYCYIPLYYQKITYNEVNYSSRVYHIRYLRFYCYNVTCSSAVRTHDLQNSRPNALMITPPIRSLKNVSGNRINRRDGLERIRGLYFQNKGSTNSMSDIPNTSNNCINNYHTSSVSTMSYDFHIHVYIYYLGDI